jgi:hypothetical protein
MSSGKLDDNGIVVGMGVSSVDGVTPVPITIDPVTGFLRCIYNSSDGGNASGQQKAKMDNNGNPTIMAETNDVNSTPTTLSVYDSGLMIQAT